MCTAATVQPPPWSPLRRLFVTGTDTDVGKTVVTACLAAAVRARQPRAPAPILAVKPIASGVTPGGPPGDAELIARAAGHRARCWLSLEAPLSPHRAQERAGVVADPADLLRWLSAQRADTVIVEGAGGWRVPLLRGPDGALFEVPDLARALGAPVLIVAADRLGTLNHTRLTVDAVHAAGLPIAGVVLNRFTPGDPSRASNLDDLRALAPCAVAVLPSLPALDGATLATFGARLADDLGLWPDVSGDTVL
jgi:dethiobiotin synthase